jgi:hypothetical protein
MMFTVGGLKFWFEHHPDNEGVLMNEFMDTPYKGSTACYAEDIASGELILEGWAYCSLQDRFDKAKGRKVALSNAIDGMSKDERTEIWYVYTKTTSRL